MALNSMSLILFAKVWVYPGATEALKSAEYKVTITQGKKSYSSFVYQDANQFIDKKNVMTDFNHWTTFSFSGKIKVTVTKLNGNIESGVIYPLSENIIPKISKNVLEFTLSNPKKLFVEMDGMYEHPLFVFADEPEKNIPNKSDPNVVWFGPGVHEIGQKHQIESNKTYYFEGGSYVKGSLHGEALSNVKIIGRGILSGIDIKHCGHNSCGFDGVAIHMFNGGKNQLVEGVTITNSSSYLVLSRGEIICRNIKGFGWWYETDGFGGGDNSLLENSFFKVNDDVVKLYGKNQTVRNLVIYQQINGAPFQFAWSFQSGQNGSVNNIDLIACEVTGSKLYESNKPVINMRRGIDNNVSNFVFSNIRADKNIAQLIGINTTGNANNITIKDVTVKGKQLYSSYIKGNVSGITIQNVSIAGETIQQDADIDLQTDGNVDDVKYIQDKN